MKFNEALELMKQGRKVKNTEWVKEDWLYIHKVFNGTMAMLQLQEYSSHYVFSLADEQSEHWEEVL